MRIGDRSYDSRADAAAAVAEWAQSSDLRWASRYASRDLGVLGTVSGFDITVTTRPTLGDETHVEISLAGVPRTAFLMSRSEFIDAGIGLIQRIENRAAGIPTLLEHAQRDLGEAREAAAEAEQRTGEPFRHAAALTQAETDLEKVETQLATMRDDVTHAGAETGLTVETVREHRPALGVRADAHRAPTSLAEPTGPRDHRPDPPSPRL